MKKLEKIQQEIAQQKKLRESADLARTIARELQGSNKEDREVMQQGFSKLLTQLDSLEQSTRKNSPKSFPLLQKIIGAVTVRNPKDFLKHVQNVKLLNPTKEVKVTNPTNLEPLRKEIKSLSAIVQKISKAHSTDTTKAYKKLETAIVKSLTKQDTSPALLKALRPLQFLTNTPSNPLSVRLSDGEKFYKALFNVITQAQSTLAFETKLALEGKLFVTILDNIDLGGNAVEQDLILIRNDSANRRILIQDIIVVSFDIEAIIRFYRNPTITANGTPMTVSNKKNPTITGVGTAFEVPTISARGEIIGLYGVPKAQEIVRITSHSRTTKIT